MSDVGPHCPYCGVELARQPQRKCKCPSCKRAILVRRLSGARSSVAVTEARAAEIDAALAAESRMRWLECQGETLGIAATKYRENLAERPELPAVDVLWGMCNARVARLAQGGEWHEAGVLYYGMALFAAEEDRDFTHLLEAAALMKLRAIEAEGFANKVEISTAGRGNACSGCAKLEGKVLMLDEALRASPLPCRECSMVVVGTRPGFCRCEYLPRED